VKSPICLIFTHDKVKGQVNFCFCLACLSWIFFLIYECVWLHSVWVWVWLWGTFSIDLPSWNCHTMLSISFHTFIYLYTSLDADKLVEIESWTASLQTMKHLSNSTLKFWKCKILKEHLWLFCFWFENTPNCKRCCCSLMVCHLTKR